MSEGREPNALPRPLPVVEGARVSLKPFDDSQISARYLAWLNDPEVNRFSRRGGQATTEADARRYLAGLGLDDAIFGIHAGEMGHVGNLKIGPVDWANSRTDLSIVVGEKRAWGKGIGTEAIYLASRFVFEALRLNRIDAGSGNPAFVRAVTKLGWKAEGVQRERVRLAGGFADWTLLAQLRREFSRLPRFEAEARVA